VPPRTLPHCAFEAAVKGSDYAKELATARTQARIRTVPYDPPLKVPGCPTGASPPRRTLRSVSVAAAISYDRRRAD